LISQTKNLEERFNYPHERIYEIEQLESEFSLIRDKQLALSNFLHIAINDENYCVRWAAVNLLESVFSDISDKQQAWEDLIKRLISDIHCKHGYNIVYALRSAFPHMPDKEQAWSDLHKLTTNEDFNVRGQTAGLIGYLFSQLPDKEQAWGDLHRLADDNEYRVRSEFLSALSSAFSHIQDKQQAWEDLHRLTKDEYRIKEYYPVRESAAYVIGSLFSQFPDKQQAWEDLCRLSKDKNNGVRHRAISSIRYALPYLPDKEQAWNDLHRFTDDKDHFVRREAAEAIGIVYPHLPDKQRAWEELYKLMHDTEYDVIRDAVTAIGVAFPYLTDKQKAWDELHKLTYDSEFFGYIDYALPSAIGVAFPYLPDKQQAWEDLCRLSTYDYEGRQEAIEVLGSAFTHVSFELHALDDLYELTKYGGEEDSDIRAYAYHSLGNIFIFKASKCTNLEDYKKELETAIDFFGKARELDCYGSPSRFYLYLFSTLYIMLFRKQELKEDFNKNMQYTKYNSRYGIYEKSNELLFKAVENLATALKQVQYLENKEFKTTENGLKFYRKYFDDAEKFVREAAGDLPFAAETIRKGIFILDKNIKGKLGTHLQIS
jgi:HEAT repeat protein